MKLKKTGRYCLFLYNLRRRDLYKDIQKNTKIIQNVQPTNWEFNFKLQNDIV